MTASTHLARLLFLTVAVAGWLGWKANHTDIIFADSLRYIHQAQEIEGGNAVDALLHSIDHPAYPLVIAAVHRLFAASGPTDWQLAAQVASVIGGVLLVVPLYLVALEMFGGASAWLAVALAFLVPITSQVMADALSESWFLTFFFAGVWTAIRFLKEGKFAWLPATVGLAAFAYWVRPEALLLPAALVAALLVIPLLRSTRMSWWRWGAAMAFLVVGPTLLIAPIIASKGGISTKPAVGRVFGTVSQSAASAVERQRPLKPNQTATETYVLATRAMAIAVRDAVTIPLLPLALLGLILAWPPGVRNRMWIFLTILMAAWTFALIRLYATSGYCTPRHALIVAYPLIAGSAFAMSRLLAMIVIPGRWVGGDAEARYRLGPIGVLASLVALGFIYRTELTTPINHQFAGYRDAAAYVAERVPPGERVVDLTGWVLYYGDHPGYTFANLIEAMGDRNLTRVVVRDSHLAGPWEYCDRIRHLVAGREPVAQFPEHPEPKQSVVFVYDWAAEEMARSLPPGVRK